MSLLICSVRKNNEIPEERCNNTCCHHRQPHELREGECIKCRCHIAEIMCNCISIQREWEE